jgi:hypothetical protein
MPECWFQSGMQGRVAFKVLNPLKKVIISVGQLRKAGYDVFLGEQPYILQRSSGIYTKVYERGGVFVLPIWVKGIQKPEKGFQGQVYRP